ncbi:gamma-glutamyltransferase [Exilibacterium tricleocarpae]|uniref:Glutathione hydrolase proenzyme n=1 Tax=Exilibacterium tricleocarpae TaxID=2591008 RepID=A0A545SNY5_9GAMM|nr:gamma-glutamyltransferase [Exilibacterium tricleocarpae]TQV66698.1 gamma-glutamyltransferase [Exilibacterium tricleocarpae]
MTNRPIPARLLAGFCLFWFAAVAPAQQAGRDNPEEGTGTTRQQAIFARDFMVVAAHPLAAQAGYNVLHKGGSAIDAAVAVQAMLTLVEPQSSGIGGGAFILHHDGSKLISYDGRETAPAAASPALFLGRNGKPDPWIKAVVGGRSVGVPGVLKALSLAHQRYGKLPWSALFDDTIRASEEGFRVSPRFAALVAAEFNPGLKQLAPAKDYFYPGGKPVKAGELLKNPELAATLRLIARQGVDAFYMGPLAEAMVAAVKNSKIAPGTLALADLAGYRVKERPAVCAPYRGYSVCSMAPPSSGGIAVLQQLKLLEPFELAFDGRPALSTLHLITQASRLAYADRDRYIADSDFVEVPVAGLMDAGYIADRRRLISRSKDMGKAQPGQLQNLARADGEVYELPSTSHVSIVDRHGNALSMTSSIEMAYGSTVMTRGFLLNNQLTDFALSPTRDGKPVANRVEPGKRPRSSMAPVMVLRDGRPTLILGSPGGSNIINYVTQTLLGVIDWKLDIQQAIAMPKISNRNGKTALEKSTYMEDYRARLEAMGHTIQVRDLNSGMHAIQRVEGGWLGGADHRREGKAMGR